MSDNFSCDNFV